MPREVARGTDNQILGEIELDIPDADDYDGFYVTVELPYAVQYDREASEEDDDTNVTNYIHEARSVESSNRDSLKAWCPNVDNIHIRFDKKGSSTVSIGRDAAPEIRVRVTVEARVGYSRAWRQTQDCVVGIVKEGTVTVSSAGAVIVSKGHDRRVAAVTLREDEAGTLVPDDRIFLKILTDGCLWELPSLDWVERSPDGPRVDRIVRSNDGRTLAVEIGERSSKSNQTLTISPRMWVQDAARAGDIRVEVSGSPEIFASRTFTVARVEASTARVTIISGRVPDVEPGDIEEAARIEFAENAAGVLRAGDRIVLDLRDRDVEWAPPRTAWISEGTHGLSADVERSWIDRQLLIITVTHESSEADRLVIRPVIEVAGDADAGSITCEVNPSTPAVPSTTLTVARIVTEEEPGIGVSVRDDRSDILYRASSGAVIDTIVVKADPRMREGETITLNIRDGGVQWYRVRYPSNLELIGFADSNRTAEFRLVNDTDEVIFEDCEVSVMPDAALGGVEVRAGGTAGTYGTVEVGEVKSPLSVTASKKDVLLGGDGQAAGDITIRERGSAAWRDGRLTLSLPDGLTFARKPRVTVNGRSVSFIDPTGTGTLEFSVDVSSGEDRVSIEDIRYNISPGAARGDVEVEIGGDAVNRLDRELYVQALAPVAGVVNARITGRMEPPVPPAPQPAVRVATFTLGSKLYTVNGVAHHMDVAPYGKYNRTYLPIRYVGYSLGVPETCIWWDGRNVTMAKGDTTVVLTTGSKVMLVNGNPVNLDAAPEVVKPGRVMLPYRWIAQAFGASVDWNPATKTVTMYIMD
ncbi:MAG: copper amine oxidase N-terminal domain-containing protein [Bacillota bacterium]|nr:copper amine oxidase N-terminal domain-containing protein [Bacillota bacterium]